MLVIINLIIGSVIVAIDISIHWATDTTFTFIIVAIALTSAIVAAAYQSGTARIFAAMNTVVFITTSPTLTLSTAIIITQTLIITCLQPLGLDNDYHWI